MIIFERYQAIEGGYSTTCNSLNIGDRTGIWLFGISSYTGEGQTMAIITISRQVGSLGNEIGKATADRLGYEYIEQFQISKSLSNMGYSLSDIDSYDEKKPSVWQTLTLQKERFSHFIQAAVYELAVTKNVVIVGRGGQVILGDIPGALHVRIVSPLATRLNRLMEQREIDEKTAHRFIRQTDRDSSGYLSTYFYADWKDSDLYDLIINTRSLTVEESVEIIARTVEAKKFSIPPRMSELLFDRSLSHKGKAALLESTGKSEMVNLEVEQRIAVLSGVVRTSIQKEECEKIVSGVHGIDSVDNQLAVQDENRKVF